MTALLVDLQRWYDQGVERGASNMVVKCDGFGDPTRGGGGCCYPVFTDTPAEAREVAGKSPRTMEVYNLRGDKDAQFALRRAFEYGDEA